MSRPTRPGRFVLGQFDGWVTPFENIGKELGLVIERDGEWDFDLGNRRDRDERLTDAHVLTSLHMDRAEDAIERRANERPREIERAEFEIGRVALDHPLSLLAPQWEQVAFVVALDFGFLVLPQFHLCPPQIALGVDPLLTQFGRFLYSRSKSSQSATIFS